MVKDRIFSALNHIKNSELEDALIQVSIAISAISKSKYPVLKDRQRFYKFLRPYEDFIYRFSTDGRLKTSDNGFLLYKNFKNNDLSDIIYKNMRCSLSHEAKLDDDFCFYPDGFGVGYFYDKNLQENYKECFGKFIISEKTLIALCIVCIENDDSLVATDDREVYLGYNYRLMCFNRNLWGKKDLINYVINFLSI